MRFSWGQSSPGLYVSWRARLVPGGRVELPLSCENQILSLARLPVPPSGQGLAPGNFPPL